MYMNRKSRTTNGDIVKLVIIEAMKSDIKQEFVEEKINLLYRSLDDDGDWNDTKIMCFLNEKYTKSQWEDLAVFKTDEFPLLKFVSKAVINLGFVS